MRPAASGVYTVGRETHGNLKLKIRRFRKEGREGRIWLEKRLRGTRNHLFPRGRDCREQNSGFICTVAQISFIITRALYERYAEQKHAKEHAAEAKKMRKSQFRSRLSVLKLPSPASASLRRTAKEQHRYSKHPAPVGCRGKFLAWR